MQEKAGLKHAWYAVFILTLATVSGFVDRQILSYLVVPMKRDLGVTDTQVSLLMGVGFVVFYSVLGIPIGRLVDRGSRRRIAAAGVALWSLMTSLSGFARTFPALMLARIGVGVGEATLIPTSVSLIADLFPRRLRGIAMSINTTGIFLGSGVGYILGAFLVERLDALGTINLPAIGEMFAWQTVFFIVGIPGFLIALLALTMREPAREEPAAAPVPFSEVLQYMRAHSRTVFALTFGFACSAAVNFGIGAWMGSFFMRTHQWTASQAGEWQGINTIFFGPVGALLGGRLSDVLVKRGRADAPLLVGMAAAAGMILTAGVYPVVASADIAKLLIIPVNIFAAMPWGAANVAMAEIMPSRMRGQGAAIYQLVVNLVAGILGPTSVALLTDYLFHDDAAVRWSLVICTVVGMTLTISLLAWGRASYRETVQKRLTGSALGH
jgi:MFS family permease